VCRRLLWVDAAVPPPSLEEPPRSRGACCPQCGGPLRVLATTDVAPEGAVPRPEACDSS